MEIVDSREIGLYFLSSVGSSFLNIVITLAIFNSSGKLPVFNIWLISKVGGLIIAGSIILINLDEIPSSPQLLFEGRVCIVFLTVSSSMFSKLNTVFICLLEMCSDIVFNITCKSLSYVVEKLIKFVSKYPMLFIFMCHTIFYNDCFEICFCNLIFDRI